MIYAYTGTPGSGKSLHAVKEILVQDSRNLPILVNYDVNPEFLEHPENVYLPDKGFNPQMLIQFSVWYHSVHDIQRPVEGSLLLIIDEAQTYFNSRSWGEQGRMEWIKFFSEHRKYGFDIILITQYLEMLDKQIRALIEYNVVHRSVLNFRGSPLLRPFLRFFMGTFQVSVFWLHAKLKVCSYRVWRYKDLFPVYDTFHLFTEFSDRNGVLQIESESPKQCVISRRPRSRDVAQMR